MGERAGAANQPFRAGDANEAQQTGRPKRAHAAPPTGTGGFGEKHDSKTG